MADIPGRPAMPLLDHFHPPLDDELPWSSAGSAWVVCLMRWLNRTLPGDEYRAFANVHLGRQVEADVAEFEADGADRADGRNGPVLTLPAAPPAVGTIPAVFPEEVEVRIEERRRSFRLAGAIELVSPGNKKEADERRAFLAKCVAYLRQGVGLVVVDVVTERMANFHNELMEMIGGPAPPMLPDPTPTYVAGYRPVHRRKAKRNEIEVWPYAAPVGSPIPSVPLGLRGGPVVPLDLEGTYREALSDSGL
jgi:hypothetical protein